MSENRARWRISVMCDWEPALGSPSRPVGVLGWLAPAEGENVLLPAEPGAGFVADWIPMLADEEEANAQSAWRQRVETATVHPHAAAARWSSQQRGMGLVPVVIPDGPATLQGAVAHVMDDVLASPLLAPPA